MRAGGKIHVNLTPTDLHLAATALPHPSLSFSRADRRVNMPRSRHDFGMGPAGDLAYEAFLKMRRSFTLVRLELPSLVFRNVAFSRVRAMAGGRSAWTMGYSAQLATGVGIDLTAASRYEGFPLFSPERVREYSVELTYRFF